MTDFRVRVTEVTGLDAERIEPLASGSLSEVLLVRWPDGRRSAAKSSPAPGVEAGMLRAVAAAGAPAPEVEAVEDGLLVLEFVENDGLFDEGAWADAGARLRALHGCTGTGYGWSADYRFGKVLLDNSERRDWPEFWAEQRLVPTAAMLGGRWSGRVEQLASQLHDLLPARPSPALLHGDLWTGNMLVHQGRLAALIDPACYYGDAEVDLAMLDLFGSPSEAFRDSYGALEPGWPERRLVYQLFPALVHLCLFGSGYAGMVDRMLTRLGA